MIINKLKYILVTIVITSFGCTEDFLDFKPIAATNSESFYQTQQDAEQAVTAAYATLNYISAWDLDYIEASDIASDDAEAGGDFVNEVPAMEAFNRLTLLSTNGDMGQAYGAMFKGIFFSNIVIEKLPPIKSLDKKADPAIIDRMIGECKFLRALNYAYLVKFYGGVPLITKMPTSSEFYLPRVSLKEIYDQIEKDLGDAIEVLPEKYASSADIGRATKGAAKALLSRILLFESSYAKNYPDDERFTGMTERWADALKYAEQVISSAVYSLPGYNGETYKTWRSPNTNGYRYEFTSDGDNSSESIFEIQCIPDGLTFVLARGSALANFSAARRYVDANGQASYSDYWGLDLPTHNLIDEFEKDGSGNTDPRMRAGIAIEGNNDSIEIRGGRRFPISFDKSVTKTYLTKYEASSAEYKDVATDWDCSPLNVRLIRYSEIYLIAAEAAIMLNQNDKALKYLNVVRTRARMCGPAGNTVPADYAAGTVITFDMLIHERRCELFCEGHRYFDMVRWRIAQKILNGNQTADGYPIVYESPKHDFFALPAREVEISNGVLKQNPGW